MFGRKGSIHHTEETGQPAFSSRSGKEWPTSGSAEASSVHDAYRSCCGGGSELETDPSSSNPWHSIFYDRLRDRALPALIDGDSTITPAASLWTGSRLWLDAFREADLEPGDRLLFSVEPSAAFLQVLVAALWHSLSIVPVPPGADLAPLFEDLDARAAVTEGDAPHAWRAAGPGGPASSPRALRVTDGPGTPDVCFYLRTSGTTGEAKWVALSDQNVLSVLASHLPHLDLKNARTLSVLPWHHAFGLILDCLPALLSEAEIIRDPAGGRDPDQLRRLARTWGATHLSAVPLVLDRLCDVDGGPGLLCSLDGGIVGGAPVSGTLAQVLSGTALRAGYGQTEASPGIALGPPGHWSANYLGRPLGCSVSIDDQGELHFQGDNACVGVWHDRRLHRLDPDRVVATGDRVAQDDEDLFFRGRTDNTFKLSNGRLVHAGDLESRLKQQFRGLDEAFVFTPDHANIAVALRASDPSHIPSDPSIRQILGSVGERLVWVAAIEDEKWLCTPKGTVARAEMAENLRRVYSQRSPSHSSSS